MLSKYHTDSEDLSDHADSSDNFQVVPSEDEGSNNATGRNRRMREDILEEEIVLPSLDPILDEGQEDEDHEDEDEDEDEGEKSNKNQMSEDAIVRVEDSANPAGITATHSILAFLIRTIRFFLMPFLKIFFAPAAQKTLVKTTVIAITISWIFVTSTIAYIMFYNQYIPPITHMQPIWFHYGLAPELLAFKEQINVSGPKALVSIAGGNSVPLRNEQVYDISVQLHVPTSDINFSIGNFMIDIELQSKNGSAIAKSSRPGILRYQSQTQRIMRVLAKAIPILIGLSEESQVITIPLIDDFMESKRLPVSDILISISDPRIQIYDAKLFILANFHGLRYYMYFYRISTALIFMFIFTSIEFIFTAIAWKGFGESLWHKLSQMFLTNQQDQQTSNDSEASLVVPSRDSTSTETTEKSED